jgi:hypothetical protein
VASPRKGSRDARSGSGCRSLEMLPLVGRCDFTVVIVRVVVAERSPSLLRDQPEDE